MAKTERGSLYGEVTARIIAELELGRLPWVQPWDAAKCPCSMEHNAASERNYSGINVLILRAAGVAQGYGAQRWLTYKQSEKAGGYVRRGERGSHGCVPEALHRLQRRPVRRLAGRADETCEPHRSGARYCRSGRDHTRLRC